MYGWGPHCKTAAKAVAVRLCPGPPPRIPIRIDRIVRLAPLRNDIYRGKDDPQEYWVSVVFREESSYRKNANDPAQNQWFGELMKLLESEPEWHDGEVVHAAHTH